MGFRTSTERVEEPKRIVKQFRCKVIRAEYHAVLATLFVDLAYEHQAIYMDEPKTFYRRFMVRRDENEYNVRAHLLREGDEITMYLQNPYDEFGGWLLAVRNHTLGDEEIPERSE